MEYSHVQQLTEDFGPEDTLDYKFDILLEITEHFHMEYNEELKRGLGQNLYDKLVGLTIEYEKRTSQLRNLSTSLRGYIDK